MYNYMVMSDITLPIDPCPAATGAGLFLIPSNLMELNIF